MAIFPIALELRIDWSELDLFGHVNNVAFMKYIQASRVNFWEHIGLTELYQNSQVAAILASTSCQFKQPLFYPGNIIINARTEFIKNTSFGIHHQLFNDKGEIAAEARDVLVMFDFKNHEKIAVPDKIRKKIEALEGKSPA